MEKNKQIKHETTNNNATEPNNLSLIGYLRVEVEFLMIFYWFAARSEGS